jgi:hypothetical protein
MPNSPASPTVREPPIVLTKFKRTSIEFDNGKIELVASRSIVFPHDELAGFQMTQQVPETRSLKLEVHADFKQNGMVVAKELIISIDRAEIHTIASRIYHFIEFATHVPTQFGHEIATKLLGNVSVVFRADSANDRYFFLDVFHESAEGTVRLVSSDQLKFGTLRDAVNNAFPA